MPASRNEIHTAAPATSPAAPSSEKIPAPTMAPTPMNAACRTLSWAPVGAGSSIGLGAVMVPLLFVRLGVCRAISAASARELTPSLR